jgi:glycerol kinase
MHVILSIDQSTAATKGFVFDLYGKLLSRADIPHEQIITPNGWVEHNPHEIFANSLKASKLALQRANVKPRQVAVIGVANQRETAVCWDRVTGEPLYNAIVWQCGRATDITNSIESKRIGGDVKDRTGLNLSPFFSAAKWGWMAKHIPQVKEAAEKGTLCCGTIDSWLVYRLTGNFKTDYSNASRTQLLNLDALQWDDALCEAFGVPYSSLPEICMSDSDFGSADLDGLLPAPVSIHGVLGDSHAALFGNHCTRQGMAKATYGTGASIMMHAGEIRPKNGYGVVTSLAWGMNGKIEYVLEGNVNYAGAVIKWMAEDIELIQDAKDAARFALEVENTNGVYLVPAFSGLGAPHFNNGARAAFVGMNRSTKKAHIVRAAEECIAFQIFDVVECVNAAAAQPLQALHVDGDPTHDAFLMQFQADLLGVPVKINTVKELSGAGAAFCAALGAGLTTADAVFEQIHYNTVAPLMPVGEKKKHISGWKAAVKAVAGADLEGNI